MLPCSKDRTGLFTDVPPFIITPDTGHRISEQLNSGISVETVKQYIEKATDLQRLQVYKPTAYYPLFRNKSSSQKSIINHQYS